MVQYKAFYGLDFLIAKLEAYGFTDESLKPINSYLTDKNIERK